VGAYGTPGEAWGVAVVGNFAYAVDSLGLRIIDVSDPSAPVETGFYETPNEARDVQVAGSYAYVAANEAGTWACPHHRREPCPRRQRDPGPRADPSLPLHNPLVQGDERQRPGPRVDARQLARHL
jgi:hypothetical protein